MEAHELPINRKSGNKKETRFKKKKIALLNYKEYH